MNPRTLRIFFIVLLLLSCIENNSFGQVFDKIPFLRQGTGKSGREVLSNVTIDSVQKQLAKIEANAKLDETTKTKVAALYREALEHLKAAESFKATRATYQTALEAAPREIEDNQKKLQQIKKERTTRSAATLQGISVDELENQLLASRGELRPLQEKQEALEKELQDQRTRPVPLGEELSESKGDLEETESKLQSLRKSSEPPVVAEARRVALEALRQKQTEHVAMLDQELLSYNARLKLLTSQFELTLKMVAFRQEVLKAIQGQIQTQREVEARKAAEETALAEQALLTKYPQLSSLVEQSNALSAELTQTIEASGRTDAALEATNSEIKSIDQKFRALKQRLEVPGMSRALAPILRRERLDLPDINRYRSEKRKRKQEIESASIRLVQVDELTQNVVNIEAAAGRVIQELVRSGVPAEEVPPLTEGVWKVLTNQKELLQNLDETYSRYLETLWTSEFAETELISRAKQFSVFLDSRLLWLPSGPSLLSENLQEFIQTASKTSSAFLQSELGRVMSSDVKANPFVMAGAACLLVLLLSIRGHLRQQLKVIAEKVADPNTDGFVYTMQALGITLLTALPVPLILFFIGWRMEQAPMSNTYSLALGLTLKQCAQFLLILGTFFHLCDGNGMAQVQFGWDQKGIRRLRRNLFWYTVTVLPLMILFKTNITFNQEEIYHGTLGRPLFILMMLVTSLFLQRVLRPRGGVLETHLIKKPRGSLSRFRHVWYPASVLLPLIAAGIATAGFVYTAIALARYIIRTWVLISAAILIYALIMRWLTRTYQYHLLKRVKGVNGHIPVPASPPGETPEEQAADPTDQAEQELQVIYERIQRLITVVIALAVLVGVYLIWVPFIPILSVFQEVTLWNYTVAAGGTETIQPFTLADLFFAVVLIVTFFALARTLPGMLDLTVLQRLSIESGTRHAVNQIARYVILTVGAIAVFTQVGGNWSQIKLVVAALGVGIGFGLQEIVANFLSGLIILFERPMRVGDTVTVGGVTGVVSRIRMRATTIIDWDNKELIVPNKTFVNEQLMNWTLSDSVVRLQIKVGIAYGSDTAKAHDLILDTVKAHLLVLEKPSPTVVFVGFGESSLDFLANVFLKGMQDRLAITHELHMAIERTLRQNGIVIPFPQRDIHVHTSVEEKRENES